jgi:hypothetical protein
MPLTVFDTAPRGKVEILRDARKRLNACRVAQPNVSSWHYPDMTPS